MDLAQILLIGVVAVLTTLLLFVGLQVYFILRDARRTLDKANKILEDASLVSSSVARPIVSAANIAESIKNFKSLVEFIGNRGKAKKSLEIDDLMENSKRRKKSSYVPKDSRIFRRSGRPLAS